MRFRPLHDRVVVKRIDPEEKSAGGIPGRPSTRASALLGIGFDPGSTDS
jgi:co-chaperonin GroES (HSP10)